MILARKLIRNSIKSFFSQKLDVQFFAKVSPVTKYSAKKWKMLRLFAQIVCIPVLIFAQQQGNQKQEYHLPITVRADGSQQKLGLVLDSNWRWLHEVRS